MEESTLQPPSSAQSYTKPSYAQLAIEIVAKWLNQLAEKATSESMVSRWLMAILIIGAIFRFVGLNWDENQHLHPDERFLTMVETSIRWPQGLADYFDSAISPLSPYNNNFGFYVYGAFPLFLVKRVGLLLSQSGYDEIHVIGRALSSLFDLGSVIFIFLIGRRLYGTGVGLLGAALLSLAALNIQQSHFFTVDTFANFFVVMAVYYAIRVSEEGHWWHYALFGVALGAGLASKIGVFTVAVVVILAGCVHFVRIFRQRTDLSDAFEHVFVRLVLAAVFSFLVFRFLQPISFQGPSLIDFSLNRQWLANMAEVSGLMSGNVDYPPGHQWTARPIIWFPWSNLVVWGMGLPLGLAASAGWGLAAWELFRRGRVNHLLPVAYVAIVFLHQGTQWVKSMRYLLPIYPFMALLAAYLLVFLWRWARARDCMDRLDRLDQMETGFEETWASRIIPGSKELLAIGLMLIVVGGTVLYAIAFTSIYTRPHSRVQASRWIYENVPKGSVLANEHWDDALPLRVDGKDGFGGWYKGLMINNYDEDEPKKLDQMVTALSQADYIILSSNRLYDSITRLPMRYPMTVRYYNLLFAEELGFRKVAEFTSYPEIFGIALPDQSAEEAFSVYDHPKVTIFEKSADFSVARVQRQLGEGIDWAHIRRLTPKQATKELYPYMAPW